jgi:hypothetical protein
MSANRTTLPEFVDDADSALDNNDGEPDGAPTPAQNAADIGRLVGLMQELTDQIDALAGRLEQHETSEYRPEDIDSDPDGMFQ